MSVKTHKKKLFRRRYLIDSAFQFRYGIWLSGIGVFCFFFMGFLAYISVYRQLVRDLAGTVPRDLIESVTKPQTLFFHYDVLVPLAVAGVFLFCIGVVGTHRIAGPLFAIKRQLNEMKKGLFRGPVLIRAGDQLQDLVSVLNSLFLVQEQKHQELADLSRRCEVALDNEKIDEAKTILRAIKAELNNTVSKNSQLF